MVVVAIFLIILSFLQPTLQKITQKSQDLICKNKLSTIYTNIVIYSEDHDHYLPGPVWYGQKPNILTSNVKQFNYLAEFLVPYFPEPLTNESGLKYNPAFICPTNEEMDTSVPIETRVNYRSNYIKGFGIPFGRKANNQKPKMITQLPNDIGYLLQDADDINYPYFLEALPDLPVHSNLTRNTLFTNGSVGITDLDYLTIDP